MSTPNDVDEQISRVLGRIAAAETLLSNLKAELQGLTDKQFNKSSLSSDTEPASKSPAQVEASTSTRQKKWPLLQHEYRRYGRQLILPEIGLPGQLQLKDAKVLIIGVGGLGCPAAAYLAGAGVGTLGLVDGDTVEESNLHRQTAHSTSRVGWNKAESAACYLKDLNPLVKYEIYDQHLTPETAISIFERYDLVLDCTDHPTSRYLISDACVLTNKPLVSASALKTDGQLIVLNNPPRSPGDPSGGPCYRCIFPKPPPPETLVSCGEGGILGPVVGTMGILQALEAIKILTSKPESTPANSPRPVLLVFSAYSDTQFRSMKMRSRRANCAACSAEATITRSSLTDGSFNYSAFCGSMRYDVLPTEARVPVKRYNELIKSQPGNLLDVRDTTQYNICHLDNSINIPWTGDPSSWMKKVSKRDEIQNAENLYLICRLGNDSQLAAAALREQGNRSTKIMDIKGGFHAWRREVDESWPDY